VRQLKQQQALLTTADSSKRFYTPHNPADTSKVLKRMKKENKNATRKEARKQQKPKQQTNETNQPHKDGGQNVCQTESLTPRQVVVYRKPPINDKTTRKHKTRRNQNGQRSTKNGVTLPARLVFSDLASRHI